MAIEAISVGQPNPVQKAPSGKNWIRRAEPIYGPPMDFLYKQWFPEDIHASDITRRGVQLVKDGSNIVFDQTGSVSKLKRSKSKGVVSWGFFLDAFDGIRSRRRGESSREGELLDLAADRTQEGYLGLNILLHNWKNMDKQSEAAQQEFLELLMIPTATVLPTLAAAQGRMLGISIPEKSPTGGSRFDRFMKLNRAFRASVNGNYEKSNKFLREMLTGVTGAYEFRSEKTIDYRTDRDKPNSFDITQAQVLIDPVSPDHKPRRDQLETWIHFVGFLDKTVTLVTESMRQAKIDPSLITAYEHAVKKQLGDYNDIEKVTKLLETWRGASPGEFVYALSDDLIPQALLGIAEQQKQNEPITVYESL